MTDEASTTTWETLVEQYRERAARDDARIDELTQRANHWHDVADMMKRQRDMAEEERDNWKIRAMRAEQERQAAKADAEHWKAEWALVLGQLGGARAEVEALRKYAARWYEHITLKAAIDAAMAVQPTTGEAP